MSRSDREYILDAQQHLAVLRQHLQRGHLDDQTVADAVSLRLAAAIESISRASDDLRSRLFGDDWSLMWATRNRIAHGYAFIDLSIITATVTDDLPWFEAALEQEIERTKT